LIAIASIVVIVGGVTYLYQSYALNAGASICP
jgi:hypothetical protein